MDEVRENPDIRPEYYLSRWLPPRQLSQRIPENPTGPTYWYDGWRIARYTMPVETDSHRTFTIYLDESHSFWIVPFDATRHSVVANQYDWRELSFCHNDSYTPNSTYACYGGEYPQLCSQRRSQLWPPVLFPLRYHVPYEQIKPDDELQYGGLIGELPILLALIAFSVPSTEVNDILPQCIGQVPWQVHSRALGRGCKCYSCLLREEVESSYHG